jgi:sensor c-di-GMP phosphodiesterase-like protein
VRQAYVPGLRRPDEARGRRRFETVRGIAKALAKDELELHYQPKLRLADGSLSGFEALLRRRMPDGRVVAAGAFQAAFADPDLSARLGAWVVERPCGRPGDGIAPASNSARSRSISAPPSSTTTASPMR